jgi:hypothetical protein
MTLSAAERAALTQQWFAEIEAEIERRETAKFDLAGGDPRQQLLDKLAEMGDRMRSAPGWVEPAPEQRAEWGRQLDLWFTEHGY